jgi:gliding motility-associated-like protein
MKKLLVCPALVLVCLSVCAQTISDCGGAIQLCGDLYTEDQAPFNTGDVYEYTGVCNQLTESNSVWYTFTVQADGLLSFIITPNDLNDDYDWALFDITTGGCDGIFSGGPSPEVSCNSWGTAFPPNGPTGISTLNGGTGNTNGPGDLNGPPFNADLPVLTGEVYALVVMNWSNSLEGYTIDFGQSTASLYDDSPPTIVSVESNCANTELTVVFSENIVVSTVQPEDFTITGPGSYTTTSVEAEEGPGTELDNTFIIQINEQILLDGTYTLTITDISLFVEDLCGNPGQGSIDFPVNVPMTYGLDIQTACNGSGGSITITNVAGGQEPYSFYLDNNLQSGLEVNELEDGGYSVLVSDNSNCELLQEVIVPDNEISLVMAPSDSVSCIDPVAEITGSFVVPDQPISYSWTTDIGNIISGSNLQIMTAGAPGVYTLTATNTENGCSVSGSMIVTSEEEVVFDATQLRFPNVVSPNGDSKNEDWMPFLANDPEYNVLEVFTEYQLRVFNRWGNLVFESTDNRRFWNAGEYAEGNYFFTLYYETECGTGAKDEVEGFIQVLREP